MSKRAKFSLKRVGWLCLGIVCVALGAIGVVMPLLPTTPFMLLAAFAFARSSDRLHHWLINHKMFGPMIKNWNEHGAISRKAKIASMISIVVIVLISLAAKAPIRVIVIQLFVLSGVATFILSRPNGPRK